MDSPKCEDVKKGLISKTWKRRKSFSSGISRAKVCDGYFSIYVGSQKERFVIKTEYVNHPLFKILLEEAESEYGFTSDGPLLLPCEADHFIKVLMEIPQTLICV